MEQEQNHPETQPDTTAEDTKAKETMPVPRPSGFVPPHILENISESKESTEEEKKAAEDTLKIDEARAERLKEPKKPKKYGIPEGNVSGKAEK
jgi:hypothetical protein